MHRARVLVALAIGLASPALAHEPSEEEEDHAPERTAPVLVERAEPIYPEAAKNAGIGGTVSLAITIGADGTVSDVKVQRGAGFGLDEAAVQAARQFHFRPATEHGRPIASVVLFDQVFVVRPHLTAEVSAEPTPAQATTAHSDGDSHYQTVVEGAGPRSAASSTTIRNQDFDLRPKTSPNDVLRVVPGLLAAQHQGGGKADQLFLRGFDADHGTDVAVFLDGVPINLPSHAHGQGYTDLHFLIPEALERIDVEKGPYDVRYGDFATAGAVNLVTRKQFDESSVGLTLGGFPSLSCSGGATNCKLVAQERVVGIVAPHLGGMAEKLHPWIAAEVARDQGPFETPEGLYRYNLFSKLAYDLAPRTQVGIFLSAYGSAWTGSGQIPSREVDAGRLSQFGSIDPSEGGLTERQMVTAFLHHRDERHELDATVYFVRYRLSLWNDFTFFLRDPQNGDEIEQDDARTVTGANLSYHLHSHWRRISLRTTVGAQLRYDGIHVDLWDATSQKRLGRHVDTSGFSFGNDDDIDQVNLAAYVEEDVAWARYFRSIVGLRADYFGFNVNDLGETTAATAPATSGSRQRTLASPKATFVFTPIAPLDLYLNFGMGFHSNDARIAVQEGRTVGNGSIANTVPLFYGGEVGARFSLSHYFTVAAALWGSYLQSETVFNGDAGAFVPAAATQRIGFDFEARAQPLSWLFVDFDLAQASATSASDAGNGGAIALAPRLYMTGGATVKRGAVRAGVRFRYLGDRPAFDENSAEYRALAAGDAARVTAPGYFLVDIYGAYRYRFIEVGLSVQNLFNATWREAQFGNESCTRDEVQNPQNPNYKVCGAALPVAQRTGVPDVHFTPGVPLNLQLTARAYF